YVGGAGLARGYLGRTALTAQRFVPDPYGAPGTRLYRSGDLARRLADGDLEYLGRNDDQVKIRGFRIELGEIQAALLAHPEVRDAAVVVSGANAGDRDRRLVAYVVPRGAPHAGDVARWQAWLAARLPAHMVPSSYVELERFPLTPNGKLDRRALPAPEAVGNAAGRASYVAPRDETEARLATIWQQVLGAERVGALDDFFLLGGHSLSAVRVISAVRAAFGEAPGLRAVFEHPRLCEFATLLRGTQFVDDDALVSASGALGLRRGAGGTGLADVPSEHLSMPAGYMEQAEQAGQRGQGGNDAQVAGGEYPGQTEQSERAKQSEQAEQPEQAKQPEQAQQAKQAPQAEQAQQVEDAKQAAHAKQPEPSQQPELTAHTIDHPSVDSANQHDVSAPIPLTPSQQSLWFLWKLDPQSAAYHVNGALRFEGHLDVDALRAAFDTLVQRHPALRMRFSEVEGVAFQRIDAATGSAIHLLELPCTPQASNTSNTSNETLADCLAALVRKPFDLTSEPPVRATLVRVADNHHVLHLVLHHIVSDDWSIGLLFADFSRLYREHCAAGGAHCVQSSVHEANDGATASARYRALIAARAAQLTPERESAQLAWWRATLATDDDSPATLALPYDRVRGGTRRAAGARHRTRVPAATTKALRALASARRATLFMTLLAAFDALLYRYSGQSDIRLGVPLAGRDLPGAADVAGFFVNTVVIRTAPRGAMRAAQLIDDVRERLLGAYANQDVPFASVVKAVQPERELTQTPLFQVLVNQQQRHDLTTSFGDGVHVTVQEVGNGEAQFDLMLNIAEAAGDSLDLTFTYATDVFEAETIERVARHFTGLLDQWSSAPDALIASFELPELDGQSAVHTPATFMYEPVSARIAAQALERPNAVALVDGNDQV
ncbi:condensation domain-containing protein, partial [Burkholderia sp. WSM2232]|uniref:condensation domain-containing protein n=1 Tax=Burkholderia sp. WSM2232 TaxID=944436 RepID=UPI00048A1509